MTKNQKILAGCGGAGCLGIIVLVVVLIVFGYVGKRAYDQAATGQANGNRPIVLRNSNGNLSARNSTTNQNSATTSSGTNESLSEDEKHRLFQAAASSGDTDLLLKVQREIGIYQNADKIKGFTGDHVKWMFNNLNFVKEMNDKDKARAYVNNYFAAH